jgi:hypothetical protein
MDLFQKIKLAEMLILLIFLLLELHIVLAILIVVFSLCSVFHRAIYKFLLWLL